MRWRVVAVVAAALVAQASVVPASERSELLVARGELAFQQRRWDEARARFADAVTADPTDAVARYQLGLALVQLERWDEAADAFEQARRLRPGFDAAEQALAATRRRVRQVAPAAERRWQLRALTGVQYDSNVPLAPRGKSGPSVGDRGDVAFLLGAGGSFDAVRRHDVLVRLDYDLYQTLHPDLDAFDFRSQRLRGTASHALGSRVWGGVQGGYNYYSFGPHDYLSEPFVMPFVTVPESDWGVTQGLYRHGEATYLGPFFHEMRDGPNDAVGASQSLTRDGRTLTLGYQYAEERPKRARGADYRLAAHLGEIGLTLPAWWATQVDLGYQLRSDGYTEPNSQAGFRKRRHDLAHDLHAGVSREIMPHVRAALVYYGTLNDSNIGIFDYRRQIVSGVLQITY